VVGQLLATPFSICVTGHISTEIHKYRRYFVVKGMTGELIRREVIDIDKWENHKNKT